MAVKFFGQFLVEKGIVSRDVLVKAIELQEQVNLGMGQIAVKLGFMTEKDVVRVNHAQRTEDERFGDLAIKLGIITSEQLQQVLATQKSNHLYIGEALVKVGGLKEADLPRYLDEFKADQAVYATDHVTIPTGVPHPDICEIIADLTFKMLIRVARLTFRQEPCKIAARPAPNDVGAAMGFTGDLTARYIFTASRAIQLKIAAAMLDEPNVEDESQELLDDTVMEFVNVVCGNIAAKIAQRQKSVEIDPPELLHAPEKLQTAPGQIGLSFPILLADSEHAELVLFIQQ